MLANLNPPVSALLLLGAVMSAAPTVRAIDRFEPSCAACPPLDRAVQAYSSAYCAEPRLACELVKGRRCLPEALREDWARHVSPRPVCIAGLRFRWGGPVPILLVGTPDGDSIAAHSWTGSFEDVDPRFRALLSGKTWDRPEQAARALGVVARLLVFTAEGRDCDPLLVVEPGSVGASCGPEDKRLVAVEADLTEDGRLRPFRVLERRGSKPARTPNAPGPARSEERTAR